MAPPAIRAAGLTKRYGDVVAVDRLDLEVATGEIYGFLGRNGAGKSTTIRMLLGMARPTRGHAEILGTRVEPGGRGPWRRVGSLVETATAYRELTVRENLEVARRLHGEVPRSAIDEAIGQLGLEAHAHRRAGALSTGNLQRLAIARALLHRPTLLLLDEPVNGLDPAGVADIRLLLGSLAEDHGTTIFISSHLLAEIERVASRVGIIHEGRLVSELSARELVAARRRRLQVGFRDTHQAEAAAAALRRNGYAPAQHGEALDLEGDDAVERPDEVARVLVHAGAPPVRLGVVQEDMETFFLRVTGGGGGAAVR